MANNIIMNKASNQLNQASDRFNSTSELNINYMIISKNKNIGLNYESVDKIENYKDKKYTIDEKNYTIDEFLEYLSEQIKFSYILELQKDIKDLEIFHLKKEFGEYYDGIHGIRVY
ncbi:14836_t:CDS:2 [Dentiscutata erythropus]|uniref:14836_t:CDS:1 n=1 Tax=Dentiscutata erythropus TaxID=1348616 RepID=A0A9N8ZJQ8_9GLOM|nr:14836_t:CDS:2 [Dentiscutata erythropus]